MSCINTLATKPESSFLELDTSGMLTHELNAWLRKASADGTDSINLLNVCGQRYIGTDINRNIKIDIKGTPGNNLGSFMNGPQITVNGNAQDGCGNTMNEGTIVVHGHAGDITGLSARGGKIFIRDGVGYRAGIHMKEYGDKKPVLVIGATAQDFCGEYMAGGVMVLLGLHMKDSGRHIARFIGTGMHGGVIYMRGCVEQHQLGSEVGMGELDKNDYEVLKGLVDEFADYFDLDPQKIMCQRFIKLFPLYVRPYGRLYAY